MKIWKRQKEMLKDYFNSTPFVFILIDVIGSISTACSIIYSFLRNYPYTLFIALAIIIFILCTIIYRMKISKISIKSLYLEKDTFLINMITNIIETKRIKEEEDNVNNVIVKELNVNYNISSLNENDSQQSALDIKWNVHCINLDESLCNYHLLYAKSESRKKAIPNATITEFGSDKYEATLTDLSNGLYNHFYNPPFRERHQSGYEKSFR